MLSAADWPCPVRPNRYPWVIRRFRGGAVARRPGGGASEEPGVGLIKDFSVWLQGCLETLVQNQPLSFFAVLFGIIFVETGLVVWPFLPGDSLLFFVGYLVCKYALSFPGVLALLVAAALLGDNVNYAIGTWLGPRVFQYEKSWLFNRKHLL